MVVVVTSFLHGACSKAISQVLLSLQPLECHVFCGLSESLHAEWIPLHGDEEEEDGGEKGEEGMFSHFGEFQALMKKWIRREVCKYVHALPLKTLDVITLSDSCPLIHLVSVVIYLSEFLH